MLPFQQWCCKDAAHNSVLIPHGFDVRQSDVSYLVGQALLADRADLEVPGFHLVHGHLEDPGTLLDQEILHLVGLLLLESPLGLIHLGNQDRQGNL